MELGYLLEKLIDVLNPKGCGPHSMLSLVFSPHPRHWLGWEVVERRECSWGRWVQMLLGRRGWPGPGQGHARGLGLIGLLLVPAW